MTSPAPRLARPYRALGSCPVCGEPAGDTVFRADSVPVLCNVLLDSAAAARAAATGSIDLVLCGSCGLLWNAAYEPERVEYSPAYENSLHFSPSFQRYATGLAADLVERHGLKGATLVEIGSGKGDFLALLCDAGVGTAIGYDPSYAGDVPPRPGITFVAELFPERSLHDADFVCARHVFEHLDAPVRVLRNVREAVPAGRRVGFYVEVPDGTYLLRELAVWDVIYEHPLHFTAPAMARMFDDAGLAVTRISTPFAGQYLAVEASTQGTASPPPYDGAELDELARSFSDRAAQLRARWSGRLAPLLDAGPVALWGAGSKGVSFLATVPGAPGIAAVVDVNPRKQGRHVPLTAQEVVGPDALRRLRPHAVVVLNPIYRDEISAMLSDAGVRAELVTDPSE